MVSNTDFHFRAKDDPISEREFMAKWRTSVGDTFESSISMSLLSVSEFARVSRFAKKIRFTQGNYTVTPSITHEMRPMLTYFPASSLPIDPAARFADLFLTRSHWKEDEIAPFLADVAVNHKERDKLLLKFARATTGPQGVWYTARAQGGG